MSNPNEKMPEQNDMDQSYRKMLDLNRVDGFDPSLYATSFSDLTTGRPWSRLPVSIQIIWFRMKHPTGKISTDSIIAEADGSFTASVRIYMDKGDDPEQYLANATATRYPIADKPEIPAKEWAQTAAIGIALRNAGFGLPFDVVGEDIGNIGPETHAKTESGESKPATAQEGQAEKLVEPLEEYAENAQTAAPMSLEDAYQVSCPIKKYAGQTLGQVLRNDAGAIKWVAEKSKDERAQAAAQLICQEARTA